MRTMYRAGGWGNNLIEAIETIKETEKTVWFMSDRGRECREAKQSSYQNWFNTFKEAKDFLMGKKQSKIDGLRRQLEVAKSEFGNLKGLKENK